MIRSSSFRLHPSAALACVVLHLVGWTALGLLVGFVDFLGVGQAMVVGLVAGLTHAVVQGLLTSVRVEDGIVTSRNLAWVRTFPIEEIQTVHRVRRRRWNGVSVRLVDGSEIVLAAPTSSVFTPNPEFAEDLGRLCAAIALSGDVSSSH